MTREGDDEVVSCLELATGKTIWNQRYPAPFFANSQANRPRLFPESKGLGPFSTPILHDGRLYTLGVSKILSCFNAADGKLHWRKAYFQDKLPQQVRYVCPPCNSACDEKEFDQGGVCPGCGMLLNAAGTETTAVQRGNYYGTVASPIIEGETGIVQLRKEEGGRIIAFDLKTGEQLWSWEGPVPASSSPVVATLGGVRQLVTLTRDSCVGVSVAEGKQLWEVAIPSNAQIVTPLVYGDLVIYAEYRLPLKAVKVTAKDGRWQAEPAWENEDHPQLMSTPILHKGVLYGFDTKKRGRFFSVEAVTGKTRWVSEGGRGQHASLVWADGVIVALTDDGQLLAFTEKDGAFHQLAYYEVAKTRTWAHPVLWKNYILVKDELNLSLWRY